MSKNFLLLLALFTLLSCEKENKEFMLKTVELHSYSKPKSGVGKLFIQISDIKDTTHILASSEKYPANMPLPVVLAVQPSLKLKLYKESCHIQLIGDSIGIIASADVAIEKNKIIFPLEIEVAEPNLELSLSGTWE